MMTLKSSIAWAAGAVAFIFLFPSVPSAGLLLDKIVAVVDKEVITWGELYRNMEFKATEELKSLGDAEKRKLFKESEAEFLENMIDTRLQIQFARRLDIDAGKEEVDEAMNAIKRKYSMGDKDFEESLKKEGFTLKEYRKLLAEQIILSKVVTREVRNKIVISETEVAEFAEKNMEPGYRIRQILLKSPEKEEEKRAVEASAEEIYGRLKAGEDFALLAVQHSNDPSGKAGGDLGFVKKRHLGTEFLETLSGMNIGDISRPFRTSRGIHIIKLEEREDAGGTDQSREVARKKLLDKRFNEEYRSWIKGLREKSFVEVRL